MSAGRGRPALGASLLAGARAFDNRVDRWIKGWNPYDLDTLASRPLEPVAVAESGMRRQAARWLLAAAAGFTLWASVAPLDAGVAVDGSVVVLGNRKAVQHPGGGVVEAIFVKEGDRVAQGQVLLRINPLSTEANLSGAELQYINLIVSESRLKSERAGRADIAWSAEVDALGADPRAAEAKALQQQLFRTRRADYQSQLAGLQAQAAGLEEVIRARRVEMHALADELRNNQQLAGEGFVAQSQVNNSLRQKTETEAGLASTLADLAKTRTQIAQLHANFLKDIDGQLSDMQKNREAYQTRLEAARFDRRLAEVRAPVAGTVVGLKVFTVGGVIQAGQLLMEVVPRDGALVAEVQIPTNLIDKVSSGLDADLRFTAFNQSSTPVIPGRVKLVGADKQSGANGQSDYYLGQVEATREGMAMLGTQVHLQPGMPVEVIVKTGERSFFAYLLKPISDRFARAFKD